MTIRFSVYDFTMGVTYLVYFRISAFLCLRRHDNSVVRPSLLSRLFFYTLHLERGL